ncbi:NAD-glutamate dehydrogenase [Salinisphaera sp. PC39]|uniref:NAD-glutamate dehydrogenase n=1 Tax=Salinisphaera sp. PC39 TaxID=1304156 RepID=UPI003342CEC8
MPASANETLIDRLKGLVRERPESDDPSDLDAFLRAYFIAAFPEQIEGRSDTELLALARCHYRLAAQRPPENACVRVTAPGEILADGALLATVDADKPFLVDTLAMAVREAGGGVDWLMHPVMRIRRDAGGAVAGIEGPADASVHGDEESLVAIQFSGGDRDTRARLAERVARHLDDLRVVVADYGAMRRRLQEVISGLDRSPGCVDPDECAEVRAFLRWLAGDHFTFLGYCERSVEEAGDDVMRAVPGSGLGLLREDRPERDPDGYVAPAAELDKYALSPRLVVVTKANRRSWIHHPDTMDVIAVKRMDDAGNVVGIDRFLGLFSGDAYAASPRDIPLLRRKVAHIKARAALRPGSHAAKTLNYILESFPRDELFQSSEEELYDTAMGILALRESQRLRLFLRRDRYGRFFSCLVYLPRERHTPALRRRVGELLAESLNGRLQEAMVQFLRGGLVRWHYIVATEPGSEPVQDVASIEARLVAATRTWRDDFEDALTGLGDADLAARLLDVYADAFPAAYTERYDAARAVADARVLAALDADDPPAMRLGPETVAAEGGLLRLKLYGRGPAPALADMLPLLENFGLHVRTQRPFAIAPADGGDAWIHEFEAGHACAEAVDSDAARRVETAFSRTWAGAAENDGLNRLVLGAGLDWREIVLVRAVARYLLQTRLPYSRPYVESLLAEHPALVRTLVRLFAARLDPDRDDDRTAAAEAELDAVHAGLDRVTGLDADRVLRGAAGVIAAVLRTNYYQIGADGRPKPCVSLKLDAGRVPELPAPLPMYETFVYAPRVEGVHLRGGPVARGGLRWSDRREDFRTEVLGLMKAQTVKNAVIVPVGAKGGFVVKAPPPDADPESWRQLGVECYKTFVRGLLDVTDNRRGDEVVKPPRTVCHDGDDPYLVVAADKGTAAFSDIANGLAREYGFWLDDAFASGGSAGYDHKAMGITARGAWESVKRHFRELGRDVQQEDFTVVGIGDMGGDVFGNGMLLSRHIRLLAAFNHRHIFIDPDPDPAIAFAERERLFRGGRSGWDAYDPSLLSEGGGVYERSAKSVELSDAARHALGVQGRTFTPNGLIHELLKAPVDLLWNGGIGTYVKAAHESDADVGDRANDAVRVDGRDLRCRAVGEGGNLGFTQAGRVEYARRGGRINTDAIDNSGGVDSSDLEVNIKIALGLAEAEGALDRPQRDRLLADMTEDVAAQVLRSNYLQTQVISVLESDAALRLEAHVDFMRTLERDGLLDRRLEDLPDDEGIEERRRSGEGLTRPELAVLVSYAKISLYQATLVSGLPDEPFLERALADYFPPSMREPYAGALRRHRLRREIVATVITNQMVDRMGVTLAHRLAAEHGAHRADAVRAYVLAAALFGTEDTLAEIEALDNRVASGMQYRLYKRVARLTEHAIGWLVTRAPAECPLHEWIESHRDRVRRLLESLPEDIAGTYRKRWNADARELGRAGVPEALATRLATLQLAGGALDIVELAAGCGVAQDKAARLYFGVGDWLGLPWLTDAIRGLPAGGRWEVLARASLLDDTYDAHRRIAAQVIERGGTDVKHGIAAWRDAGGERVTFVRDRLAELRAGDSADFARLSVAVRDLDRLGG